MYPPHTLVLVKVAPPTLIAPVAGARYKVTRLKCILFPLLPLDGGSSSPFG